MKEEREGARTTTTANPPPPSKPKPPPPPPRSKALARCGPNKSHTNCHPGQNPRWG